MHVSFLWIYWGLMSHSQFKQSVQTTEPILVASPLAAATLSISVRTLGQLTHDGKLPCVRVGRLVRYRPDDLKDWISRKRQF